MSNNINSRPFVCRYTISQIHEEISIAKFGRPSFKSQTALKLYPEFIILQFYHGRHIGPELYSLLLLSANSRLGDIGGLKTCLKCCWGFCCSCCSCWSWIFCATWSSCLTQALRCWRSFLPAAGSTVSAGAGVVINCVTSWAHCENPARNLSAYDCSCGIISWFWRFRLCRYLTVNSRISAFSSLETFSPSLCRAVTIISFNSSRHRLMRALLFLSSIGFITFLYW